MARTIQDTVKSIKTQERDVPYVSKVDKSQSTLEKIVNKTIDVGFIGLAAKYYLTSSLLTFSGFFVADMITKKKKKEKLTLGSVSRSMFNSAADAALNGGVQEELYKRIEGIPNNTWLNKFKKTFIFEALVTGFYLPYYLAQQYLRYDIGYTKAIGAIFNPKTAWAYLKDFYHTKIKGQYWSKVKTLFTRLFPIHFATMNYLTPENFGPTYLPLRMGTAAGNDVIFALTSKLDKKEKKSPKVNQYKTKQLKPNYGPAFERGYNRKFENDYKLAA